MSCYYVGLDVHKASICIAVLNADGKLVIESVIETSAATILGFLKGLHGRVHGSMSAYSSWLVKVRSCRPPSLDVVIKRISLRVMRPSRVAREQTRALVKCDCGEVW